MTHAPSNTVTLRALEGAPLANEKIRDMVVATAHSIAERNNVKLLAIAAQPDRVVATLALDRLASIGFAAELRRLTNRWYSQKFGVPNLWGEHPPTEPDHYDPMI